MAKQKKRSAADIRRIMAIDIGGTGIKAAIVGPDGKFLTDKLRIQTPSPCAPHRMLKLLGGLAKKLGAFDHVSVGFPGYVRGGKVFTAPHLGSKDWAGFAFADALAKRLGAPVRLNNDADVQGLGFIRGKGLEMVCTLGTGFGTAWFRNGELLPHMDLSHFAVHKKSDIDVYIGEKTRKQLDHKEWNKRVKKLITMLATVMNYDHLYLGGGNAQRISFQLPDNVSVVSNDAGMEGSAFVWKPKHRAG